MQHWKEMNHVPHFKAMKSAWCVSCPLCVFRLCRTVFIGSERVGFPICYSFDVLLSDTSYTSCSCVEIFKCRIWIARNRMFYSRPSSNIFERLKIVFLIAICNTHEIAYLWWPLVYVSVTLLHCHRPLSAIPAIQKIFHFSLVSCKLSRKEIKYSATLQSFLSISLQTVQFQMCVLWESRQPLSQQVMCLKLSFLSVNPCHIAPR